MLVELTRLVDVDATPPWATERTYRVREVRMLVRPSAVVTLFGVHYTPDHTRLQLEPSTGDEITVVGSPHEVAKKLGLEIKGAQDE